MKRNPHTHEEKAKLVLEVLGKNPTIREPLDYEASVCTKSR